MNDAPLPPGTRLADRYELVTPVGTGAFGSVWRARRLEDGEAVAVKLLHPSAARSKDLVRRFEREAEICGALQHPNTARMLDVRLEGTREAPPFMVFELVRGLPLGSLLTVRGTFRIEEATSVLLGVLGSLSEAHRNGILHRDLKPDNILVAVPPEHLVDEQDDSTSLCARLGVPEPDHPVWSDISRLQVKVVDFGLGKLLELQDRKVHALTQAGVTAGTAHYMSPEQARADAGVDYRADLYGAALLFYTLLTGREPFPGDNVVEVIGAQISAPPPPLPAPWEDGPLGAFFRRSVAKKPDDRWQHADEMAWELRCALDPSLRAQSAPVMEEPPPPVTRKGFWRRLFG